MKKLLAYLLVILLTAVSAFADFHYKINLRKTSGYVTDGVGETYSLGEAYPVTRGGVTFGWSANIGASGTDECRDRNSGLGPNFAGMCAVTNDGTQRDLRIDLEETGIPCEFGLAGGDATSNQAYHRFEFFDNTTPIGSAVVDADGTTAGNFNDATGTAYSAANWPANNTAISHTFSSSIFKIRVGASSSQSNSTPLAHVYISCASESSGNLLLLQAIGED